MREVDRVMVEELGVEIVQMMEHAGRAVAQVALEHFDPSAATVLAGKGGNGGGGMAAARHLANRGVAVTVTTTRPPDALQGAAGHQAGTLRGMGVPFSEQPPASDLVVDALVGYSLDGDPRGRVAELIAWSNDRGPVLALDLPSGLDATTGRIGDPCVRAAATVTIALPKQGLLASPEVAGDLYLADISVPPSVYERFGIEAGGLFEDGWVVRV